MCLSPSYFQSLAVPGRRQGQDCPTTSWHPVHPFFSVYELLWGWSMEEGELSTIIELYVISHLFWDNTVSTLRRSFAWHHWPEVLGRILNIFSQMVVNWFFKATGCAKILVPFKAKAPCLCHLFVSYRWSGNFKFSDLKKFLDPYYYIISGIFKFSL